MYWHSQNQIKGLTRTSVALFAILILCFTPAIADIPGLEDASRILSTSSCSAQLQDRRIDNEQRSPSSSPNCAFFRYSVDNLEIAGFAVAPDGAGPFPVVIFNRGGTADFGQVSIGLLAELPALLADHGFFVIGSQYRGGTEASAEIEGIDEWGGGDVDDVLALLDIIDSLAVADGEQIGMFGASRGAVNMFMAARRSDRFHALVGFSGSYDLTSSAKHRPRMIEVWQRYMPDYADDPQAALRRRSVLEWSNELSSELPILILHGAFDERVNATQALRFTGQLQAASAHYKLIIYEYDDHALSRNRSNAYDETIDWFKKHLRQDK